MRLFSVKKKANEDLNSQKKKIGLVRKVLVVTGCMMALFMCASVVNNPMLDNMIGVETSYASELPYSHRWEIKSDGSWMYKMDEGGYATNKWLRDEVDHNWYLMDESGIMRSGIYKSYGKYYLLSEIHDGHFGHLVKNGEVYQGITIKADTSSDYEGALSAETIQALKGLGFKFETVEDISGTSHVTDGKVSFDAGSVNTTHVTNNSNTIKTNESQVKGANSMTKEDYENYFSNGIGSMFGSTGGDNRNNFKPIDRSNEGTVVGQ